MSKPSHQQDEQEFQSINDVIRKYRATHPTRHRYLTNSHLTLVISWLILRYIIAQPVINYFKDLIEEQKHGLLYKSKRGKNL
jgi:hypothetical protein